MLKRVHFIEFKLKQSFKNTKNVGRYYTFPKKHTYINLMYTETTVGKLYKIMHINNNHQFLWVHSKHLNIIRKSQFSQNVLLRCHAVTDFNIKYVKSEKSFSFNLLNFVIFILNAIKSAHEFETQIKTVGETFNFTVSVFF